VSDAGPAEPSSAAPQDTYTRYLDLPPGPRPPNLYQLIQLELFCSNLEQIRHAARKQFRRIKPCADHPDRATRDTIQDIITQIATARVVLTDPAQKEGYDRALAEELGLDRDEYLRNRVAVPVPDCQLRITAGPDMIGECIDLVEGIPTTIGSDPHCVISLSSARMGKLHCQLECRDEHWLLSQVDEQHPTLVNEQRCRQFLLVDGDALDMGGYRLRFVHLPETSRKPDPTRAEPADPSPPPISLITRRGPCVPAPVLNALPTESILIGHCDTALWQLPGPLVSRHHCRVQPAADHWEICDLRSTNGTMVNGQRIERSAIEDRDQLTIGRFEILVSLRR
jgi:pSer/pThr/pTyr-binding forkhead associated (FHA) protein